MLILKCFFVLEEPSDKKVCDLLKKKVEKVLQILKNDVPLHPLKEYDG